MAVSSMRNQFMAQMLLWPVAMVAPDGFQESGRRDFRLLKIKSHLNKGGRRKKSHPEDGFLFGDGGGGGNRTRVHKQSTFGSTCLATSFI